MADDQNTNWEYKATEDAGSVEEGASSGSAASPENITWSANEFIEHDRGAGWYMVLILATVFLAVVIYFITKDYFAVGATLAVGIIASVYASHKPKHLEYELSNSAIKIGERSYNYNLFKSFSVAHESEHTSINLEPTKRFMPPMTVYFPPEKEDIVTEAIGAHLPMVEHQANVTERLAHRLRF